MEEFVVFVSVFKSPGKRWIHVMLEIDMWGGSASGRVLAASLGIISQVG